MNLIFAETEAAGVRIGKKVVDFWIFKKLEVGTSLSPERQT